MSLPEKKPDPQIERARRELAAVSSILDIFEPLDPEQRKRSFAAVLCTEYPECADAAIEAFSKMKVPR